MAYCTCPDWVGNIDKVDADTMTAHARNPNTHPGYTGKPFTHCPWCGFDLFENDNPNAPIKPPLLDT